LTAISAASDMRLSLPPVMQRIPEVIVVPSHDQRAYAEMARLLNMTTKGLLL
jgi:hypothetical protein